MRNKQWAVTALLVLVGIASGALGERWRHRCTWKPTIAIVQPTGEWELTDIEEKDIEERAKDFAPGTFFVVVKVGEGGAVFSMPPSQTLEGSGTK